MCRFCSKIFPFISTKPGIYDVSRINVMWFNVRYFRTLSWVRSLYKNKQKNCQYQFFHCTWTYVIEYIQFWSPTLASNLLDKRLDDDKENKNVQSCGQITPNLVKRKQESSPRYFKFFPRSCKNPWTYYWRNHNNIFKMPNRCNFKTPATIQ